MELNKVEVKAKIGGKDCYIISMRLEQGFNCHHTFEIVVDYGDLDSLWMESAGKTFNLLGEEVQIEMKHRKGDGMNLFTGVITQVSYIGHHGGQNHIRISGCSPTIKLDGSKTMDSFMDMTLNGIVSEAVGTSGNGGAVTSQPKFTGKIDYICQYDETCFEFLNRLSWIYGEWFFFDGQKCYFGRQDGKKEVITFESEMTTFDLSANLVPSKMKRYHYLVHDDYETDTKAPDPSVIGYHTVSKWRSSQVYTSDATLPTEAVALNMYDLDVVTEAEKNRATFNMLTISGTSQTSKVRIGGRALVKLPARMKTTKKEVDTFLVTSVVHEYDLKAEYRNTFKGIPDIVQNIPMQPVNFPKAFPQLATVKTNDDEKKLGRVKVQTQWQKDTGKTTNWIRVQTPDAGKSDIVPKNRGFIFIPEKDDIVMLDFEYGDPNRPYVAGSIFSEKVSQGGKENNRYRSIIDKSNNILRFDSKTGITIVDQAGSCLVLDGKGNGIIRCPGTFSIFVGEKMKLNNDKESISGESGSILTMDNKGYITLLGSKIQVGAREEIVRMEDTQLSFFGDGQISIVKKDGSPISKGEILIRASDDITAVSDNTIHIDGKNLTEMKGGEGSIVEYNSEVHIN